MMKILCQFFPIIIILVGIQNVAKAQQDHVSIDTIATKLSEAFEDLKKSYITTTNTFTVGGASKDGFDEMGVFEEKLYRKRKIWTGKSWFETQDVFDGNRTGTQEIITKPPLSPEVSPATVSLSVEKGKLLGANYFMEAIGAPFFDFIVEDKIEPDQPFNIVNALRTGNYSAIATTETIHNYKCISLETKFDKIWVCPEFNYSVVRRIRRYSRKGTEILREHSNFDFRKLTPRLWLPSRTKTQIKTDGLITDDVTSRVVSTKFGKDVPSNLFEIGFPAGATVIDASAMGKKSDGSAPAVNYKIGVSAEETARNLEAAVTRRQLGERNSLFGTTQILLLSFGICVVLGVWYLALRSKNK